MLIKMDLLIFWLVAMNLRTGNKYILGSISRNYTDSNRTILPSVLNQGVVVDIDSEDIDNDGTRDIVITRTGEPPDKFYNGYYIQIVISEGNRQFADETNQRFTNDGSNDQWIDWIRLQDYNNDGSVDIVVDDAIRELIWFNNGDGSFQ